jgi:hypothetical protein
LIAGDVVVGSREKDKGWAKFVEIWRPDDVENGALWDTLDELLSLGFVREHPSLFASPYLSWRFPSDLDPRTHLVVIRDNAALRQGPSINSPVREALSFEIVRRLANAGSGADELHQWVYVGTFDGKAGYVDARDVRSPLMPRAQFALRRGKWLMVALEGR